MKMLELPASFESFSMDGKERRAVLLFFEKALEVAPTVKIIAPRRSSAKEKYIKIVLEFPEGDTWDMTTALAGVVTDVQKMTGIFLVLD